MKLTHSLLRVDELTVDGCRRNRRPPVNIMVLDSGSNRQARRTSKTSNVPACNQQVIQSYSKNSILHTSKTSNVPACNQQVIQRTLFCTPAKPLTFQHGINKLFQELNHYLTLIQTSTTMVTGIIYHCQQYQNSGRIAIIVAAVLGT